MDSPTSQASRARSTSVTWSFLVSTRTSQDSENGFFPVCVACDFARVEPPPASGGIVPGKHAESPAAASTQTA